MVYSISKALLTFTILICSIVPAVSLCMLSEEETDLLIAPWKGKLGDIDETIECAREAFLLEKSMRLDAIPFKGKIVTNIKAHFDFTDQTVTLYANNLYTSMNIQLFLEKLFENDIPRKTRKKRCNIQ